MEKPSEYQQTYVLSMDVEYNNAGAAIRGTHSSQGLLSQGRVVWLREDPHPATETPVPAYAEGVGIVMLAPEAVKRVA